MLPEEDHGLVLNYAEKGEKFWSLAFLSHSQGLYHPLVRKTKRGNRPDLFDTGQARISRAKQGELIFLSDYYPTRRRSGLARSYEILQIASRFAEILRKNSQHLADYEVLFQISERFFDSLETGPSPRAAYLKTLYLFAKTEGLPVREDWASQLSDSVRKDLETILKSPLEEQPTEVAIFKGITSSLEQWLTQEAHFLVPKQSL